jgi:serine/threonine-protein kinase
MSSAPFARSGALASYAPRPSSAPRSMEATAMVRPVARTGRFVMIGLIAAAAVVAGVLLWPQKGRIVINISDSKGASVNRADIFVDGRKQCDTAPCRVEDMSAGSHEIKVLSEGSETPLVLSVAVESGKEATAAFTVASRAGLKVSGTQPGVKLYVDDKELGPLPQEVRDLAPGDHVIKLAGSERYQPLEKHVTIEKDKVEDLGAITLKVLKGKATISLATPGARVFLASGTDRRELPMLPISVDIDTAKAWSLQASKPGFVDFSQPISFDDGQAEKSFAVSLETRGQAAPQAQAYVAPPPAPAPAPQRAPAPPPANPPPATAGGGEAGGEAFLNINSIPPSTCVLDGKSLGTTPKVHISVSPGTHTVKFVNADQGLTKTISVTVGAGETKPAVAKLN